MLLVKAGIVLVSGSDLRWGSIDAFPEKARKQTKKKAKKESPQICQQLQEDLLRQKICEYSGGLGMG